MKTNSIKASEISRDWYIVDAKGKTLGRLASNIAQVIRGKKKPFFTPHMDMEILSLLLMPIKYLLLEAKRLIKHILSIPGIPEVKKKPLLRI